MDTKDYWIECVANAFGDAGIAATNEQIARVASDVQTGHECYGLAFTSPENHLIQELDDTRRALAAERSRVTCRTCDGRGSVTASGGVRSSTSRCWTCNGDGKVSA